MYNCQYTFLVIEILKILKIYCTILSELFFVRYSSIISTLVEWITIISYYIHDFLGVIWLKFVPIPGAFACMKNLRKQDKKIHYVSNNGLTSAEYIFESLCKGDVDLTSDDLVVPSETMVYYLKKINFKKEIFPICMDHMKNRLEKNGFKLAPELVSRYGLDTVHSAKRLVLK